jgi:hypothetical protein
LPASELVATTMAIFFSGKTRITANHMVFEPIIWRQ